MKRHILLWLAGFGLLVGLNLVVEMVVLPGLGLDATPRNDIYFMSWWVIVGFWLVFGLLIVRRFKGPPATH